MRYNFPCLHCGASVGYEWEKRFRTAKCPSCGTSGGAPYPVIEQRAWVESDEAPEEMRKVVFEVKGTKCTAYGCSRGASTLVHRVPPKDGGRTSVENLFPVCDEHAHDPDSRDVGWSFWPRVSRVHIR